MDVSETTPKERSKFSAFYEKYMLVMGVFGQLIFYNQGIKIFMCRSAQNVSITAFIIGLISVTSWLIYGILLKNRVLIVANIVAVIGAIFALVGILIYS